MCAFWQRTLFNRTAWYHHAQILRCFGPGGIRDYAHVYGGLGRITDDTQMTLFTAEGMMRAHVRARLRGTAPAYASVTALAYQRGL